MGLIEWTIAAWIGGATLVVLLFAIWGRKVDRLPRCKRRRCRYDLVAILGEERPGRAYPVTCSECGRVMESERDVRWGRRKARKWLLIPSLVVLLACAGVGGFEVYARTTNTNPFVWMPLWLLIERAEHDSAQNSYVHRAELLRRAKADEISPTRASRVLDQILKVQTDDSKEWIYFGDVFAYLAMHGHATQTQVDLFWSNAWRMNVDLPDRVAEDRGIQVSIYTEWRGMSDAWVYDHLRSRRPINMSPYIETATWMFLNEIRSGIERVRVEVDGKPLEAEFRGPNHGRVGFTASPPPFPMLMGSGRGFIGGTWTVRSLVGEIYSLPLVIRHGKSEGEYVNLRVAGAMTSALPAPDSTMSWRSLRMSESGAASSWGFDKALTLEVTRAEGIPPATVAPELQEWLSNHIEIEARVPYHTIIVQRKAGAPPPPTLGKRVPIEVFEFNRYGAEAAPREWRLTEFVLTDDWSRSSCTPRRPHPGHVNRGEPPRKAILRGYRDLVALDPGFAYWDGKVHLEMPIVHTQR